MSSASAVAMSAGSSKPRSWGATELDDARPTPRKTLSLPVGPLGPRPCAGSTITWPSVCMGSRARPYSPETAFGDPRMPPPLHRWTHRSIALFQRFFRAGGSKNRHVLPWRAPPPEPAGSVALPGQCVLRPTAIVETRPLHRESRSGEGCSPRTRSPPLAPAGLRVLRGLRGSTIAILQRPGAHPPPRRSSRRPGRRRSRRPRCRRG